MGTEKIYETTNWMLDEAKKTCEKCLKEKQDERVFNHIEHTIQKIEYGRTCINQVLSRGGQTPQSFNDYIKKLDLELQEKIIEMGFTPTKINHLEKGTHTIILPKAEN